MRKASTPDQRRTVDPNCLAARTAAREGGGNAFHSSTPVLLRSFLSGSPRRPLQAGGESGGGYDCGSRLLWRTLQPSSNRDYINWPKQGRESREHRCLSWARVTQSSELAITAHWSTARDHCLPVRVLERGACSPVTSQTPVSAHRRSASVRAARHCRGSVPKDCGDLRR